MYQDSIECHGFVSGSQLGAGGMRLQRVPDHVREEINPGAQQKVLRPAGNELRCVTADGRARLRLSSPDGGIHAVPFFGGFQTNRQVMIGEDPVDVELGPLPDKLAQLDPSLCRDMPFSPRVLRLVMHGGGQVVLHGAEGAGIRPPTAEELPTLRLLTYGTSITHGAAASMPHLSYVRQLAWRLGADLINLGVGGSCHCEPTFADFIAGRDDWDVAVLALSVNMIGAGFTPEQFFERVSYMVNTVAGADTSRPVACVTIYPHFRDFPGMAAAAAGKAPPEVFREQLRGAVAACPHPNAHLIEGREVLDDVCGLTGDLVHPNDLGMIRMGENLARLLRPLL